MADAKQLSGEAPQRFGNYWLDAELAKGGMSRLIRARLRGPGGFEKKLVVKQILPQLAQDPAFIEMFVREANTLVQMSHPNIVPVYELGVIDGVYFLSMELVEGATVAELLRDGPLPEALCAHIGAQVCEALRYAHERFGLVHRDVTPRNVIVDADGHVRLLDFGIAALPAHTGHGELFGSPGYMSPEQIRGLPLSGQSDLFSLGTVLYEALTGELALKERAPDARDSMPPRLEAENGDSGELPTLVNELLARDPTARPASAADAGARFRTWLAQQHPQGVAAALGQRAQRARTRAQQPSEPPPAPLADEGGAPQHTPRVTRSIATSRSFVELMASGTERIARGQSPVPAPVDANPRPGSGMRWLRAAVLASILAGCSLAWLYGTGLRSDQPTTQRASAATVAVAGSEPVAEPVAESEPGSEPESEPGPGPEPESESGTGTGTGSGTESGTESGTGTGSGSGSGAGGVPVGARGARAPATSVAAAALAAPTAPPSSSPARAHLSINALPWAEVRIDGRALGTTPKRALALAPGAHTLQLDCPPLGRQARVPLKLLAGADQHVLVDLQADPPRVTLR